MFFSFPLAAIDPNLLDPCAAAFFAMFPVSKGYFTQVVDYDIKIAVFAIISIAHTTSMVPSCNSTFDTFQKVLGMGGRAKAAIELISP